MPPSRRGGTKAKARTGILLSAARGTMLDTVPFTVFRLTPLRSSRGRELATPGRRRSRLEYYTARSVRRATLQASPAIPPVRYGALASPVGISA
jgi:hypothetical protein